MREISIHTQQNGRQAQAGRAPARPQAGPAGLRGQAPARQSGVGKAGRRPMPPEEPRGAGPGEESRRPMPEAGQRRPMPAEGGRRQVSSVPRQGGGSMPPPRDERAWARPAEKTGRPAGPRIEPQEPPSEKKAKKSKKKRRAKKALPETAAPRRRITRAEARRSRLKKRIWTFLLILLLIGVGIYVSVTLLFKIGKYEIQGDSPYTLEEITGAFGHAQGENIFSFSLSDAEKQIAQKLPYLETVKVRRRLPDTIVFIVEPAKERYCAQGAGGFVVLSQQFKILRTAEEAPLELCRIDGVNAKSTVAGTAFQAETEEQQALMEELLPALEQSGISGVGQIDLTDSYALSFTVDGGRIRVLLGTTVKLDYKLKTVYKMLTDQLAPDSRGTLDVTAAPSTGKTIFKQDVTK